MLGDITTSSSGQSAVGTRQWAVGGFQGAEAVIRWSVNVAGSGERYEQYRKISKAHSQLGHAQVAYWQMAADHWPLTKSRRLRSSPWDRSADALCSPLPGEDPLEDDGGSQRIVTEFFANTLDVSHLRYRLTIAKHHHPPNAATRSVRREWREHRRLDKRRTAGWQPGAGQAWLDTPRVTVVEAGVGPVGGPSVPAGRFSRSRPRISGHSDDRRREQRPHPPRVRLGFAADHASTNSNVTTVASSGYQFIHRRTSIS